METDYDRTAALVRAAGAKTATKRAGLFRAGGRTLLRRRHLAGCRRRFNFGWDFAGHSREDIHLPEQDLLAHREQNHLRCHAKSKPTFDISSVDRVLEGTGRCSAFGPSVRWLFPTSVFCDTIPSVEASRQIRDTPLGRSISCHADVWIFHPWSRYGRLGTIHC